MNLSFKRLISLIVSMALVLSFPDFTWADTQAEGQPVISGLMKTVSVREYKSKLNVRSGVKAHSASGQDLTNRIVIKVKFPDDKSYGTTVKKTVRFNKIGTYKFQYSVTDSLTGEKTKAYRTIEVKDTKAPLISSKDQFASLNLEAGTKQVSYKQLMSGVAARLVSGKNMTSMVSIKIKDPAGAVATVTKNGKYRLSQPGTYTVTYLCVNYNKSIKNGLYETTREERLMVLPENLTYELIVSEDQVYYTTGQAVNLKKKVYVKVTDTSVQKGSKVQKLTEGITCQISYKKTEKSKAKAVQVEDMSHFILEHYGIYRAEYRYCPKGKEEIRAVCEIRVIADDTGVNNPSSIATGNR